MIRLFLLFLLYFIFTDGKHFYGGTITWQPINPNDNSTIVTIIITQAYSWNLSIINCAPNIPISTPAKSGENVNLTCVDNCATDGNYSINPVNILTDCQTVSSLTNVVTSQRSVKKNLTAGAYFSIAYTWGNWIGLNNPPNTNLDWSMVCSIDLRLRPDGLINTAPVASVVSPQYAIVNQTTLFTIPVSDANAGDDVRCRWANNTAGVSPSGVDECNGICYPTSLPTGTTLSNCTVSFIGPISGIFYGVAIQVEDFINSTSLTPMSSIPVQFLIYVLPQPPCGLSPVMLPLEICFDVQVSVPISLNMSAMTQCDPNVSNIDSIVIVSGISGMSEGNLTNSVLNESVSYVTYTWTPSVNQVGSQQLCVLASTNESVQSSPYCVRFNVISSPPICLTSTTSPTSTTSVMSTVTSPQTTTSAIVLVGTMTIEIEVVKRTISKELLMWLALFLPILLVSICCSCILLYCWYWNPKRKRLRRKQKQILYGEKLIIEIDT